MVNSHRGAVNQVRAQSVCCVPSLGYMCEMELMDSIDISNLST